MGLINRNRSPQATAERPGRRAGDLERPDRAVPSPPVGSYLTDGERLMRVAHTLPCAVGGVEFLALEDCSTLELVLCPASMIAERCLRAVTPAPA